jgi:hypothetical protein
MAQGVRFRYATSIKINPNICKFFLTNPSETTTYSATDAAGAYILAIARTFCLSQLR